jgi:integrase
MTTEITTAAETQAKSVAHLKRKAPYAGPTRFTVEQVRDFLSTAHKLGGMKWLAMFLCGFANALRASEIADMRVSDLDMPNKNLTIRRLKGSNNSHPAMQCVAGYCQYTVLKAWLKERATQPGAETDVLFPSRETNEAGERRLHRSQIYRIFTEICVAAGFAPKYQHPHVLRHSICFIMAEMGAPLPLIQKVSGHKTLASLGIYLTETQDDANVKVAKLFKKMR